MTISAERITAVGAVPARGKVVDLGNAAILPGLINAHAHLDLSDVPAPLGQRGIGLVEWLGRVVDFRRCRPAGGRDPVELGLEDCTFQGTTGLGEIAQPDWPAAAPCMQRWIARSFRS